MKMKKIVSVTAALAITMSAFAGLGITARAADNHITGSYDEATEKFEWKVIADGKNGTFTTDADDAYADLTIQSDSTFNALNAEANTVYFFRPSVYDDNKLPSTLVGYLKITPKVNGSFTGTATLTQTNGNAGKYEASIYLSEGEDLSGVNTKADKNLGNGTPNNSTSYTPAVSFNTGELTAGTTYVIYMYQWYVGNVSVTFSDLAFAPTVPPGKHGYTVKAVDENGEDIENIATGSARTGETYSVSGIHEVISANGAYYQLNDETVVNYTSPNYEMGEDDEVQSITYKKNDSIVYFSEGETYGNTANNATLSGGQHGAMPAANSMGSAYGIGTFDAGVYKVTAYLVERPDRGLLLRDKAGVLDHLTNADVIATIVNNDSNTGICTADFTLTQSTNLALTGRTADNDRTNQSAGFDYIIIEKTGELVTFSDSQVEIAKQGEVEDGQTDNTGTMRFSTKVEYNEEVTPDDYGFVAVNFKDKSTQDEDLDTNSVYTDEKYVAAKGSGVRTEEFSAKKDGDVLESGKSYYFDVYNVPIEKDGLGLYAVPYIKSGDSYYWGSPFTKTDFGNWAN